jgi:hypothetical protein
MRISFGASVASADPDTPIATTAIAANHQRLVLPITPLLNSALETMF